MLTKMLEQDYVIKIFTDESVKGIDIVCSHREHYGEGAMSQSEMYIWIAEMKRGEKISTRFRALGECLIKVSLILSFTNLSKIITCQRESLQSLWILRLLQFVIICKTSLE
jgi:hypothetical protein